MSGAHQQEPLSPLIPLVNPFPSRFIYRTAFSSKKYHFRWVDRESQKLIVLSNAHNACDGVFDVKQ